MNTGGFGSYLLAMSQRINELSEAKDNDFKNPSLGWMIGFLFIVSFLGPFLVLLFRKVYSILLYITKLS